MAKLVTLEEVELYEAELRRAHAENRSPGLLNPYDVHAATLGNVDTHTVEVSSDTQKKETAKLHKGQKDALKNDERVVGIIRDNSNRMPDENGKVLPLTELSPERHDPPKNKEEKAALDAKVQNDYQVTKEFHDGFSDNNIPNLDENGAVMGDSINRKFTLKQPTSTPDELARQDKVNEVPVLDRPSD